MMTLDELRDYDKWVGRTALDVYHSAAKAGGWQKVFPGHLPRWASRVRQYFNVTPMLLSLLDEAQSNYHLARAQTALPASARAKAYRRELQSRGMGISFHAPGSSTRPGTWLKKPDPKAVINGLGNKIGTAWALSGDVYEDVHGRSIWYQMSPGGAIYHTGELIWDPQKQAVLATLLGQEHSPVFKLVCPDGTGGSREVCIKNPFVIPDKVQSRNGAKYTKMVGTTTIGAVGDMVSVSKRMLVTDSVTQGSYNYAETTEKGLPEHERLDVRTDPMKPGYYVEPPDLFEMQFIELNDRRFPRNDPEGQPLAAQNKPAP